MGQRGTDGYHLFNWVGADKFYEMCWRCEHESIEKNNSGAREQNKASFSTSHLKVFKACCEAAGRESSVIYFWC